MKKLLTLVLTAFVLFAVSATGSWLLLRFKAPAADAASGTEKAGGTSTGESGKGTMGGGSAMMASSQMGSLRRWRLSLPTLPGADEAVQLANSLRERLAGVREKETDLKARQNQLEIIRQDIRGERAAIDELRKQANEELKAIEERLPPPNGNMPS